MHYEHLRVRVENRVGWLEYHRPPVNAFNWEMLREVPRALEFLLQEPNVRVVVFTSALEDYFTAGADIRVMLEMDQESMRTWVTTCHALVRQMRQARKPLLAAIHGTAVGGGLEIVTHCDIRFAAADARLGQPEINIAFIPPVGATQSLARLLGRPRALRFLYEGTLVSAEEARAAIRRCITEGLEVAFEDGLNLELEAAVHLAGTPDFAESVRAFLDKRPPNWQ